MDEKDYMNLTPTEHCLKVYWEMKEREVKKDADAI